MAYSKEQIESVFKTIIKEISENARSLRDVLRDDEMPSSQTFFKWIREDKEKSKQYARACEIRADKIFDEILEIADEKEADVYIVDGVAKIDGNTVQRSRLRVDARKWALSKMNPKKYGDKIETKHSGEIKTTPITGMVISNSDEG